MKTHSNLLNKEDLDRLNADPSFQLYKSYLRMRLDDLREAWSIGNFAGAGAEEEQIRAQAEAENLSFQLNLGYDDISQFYIATGRKKETEHDGNSTEE